MPRRLDSISRFSPGNCAPELLESILVGRGQLVDRLEKSVLDSIETGAGHHWLVIGPRGTGKTHLLAIVYNRIDMNPQIRSRVVIAYMKEEERGVASFLDWLVRILRAFHRRGEEPPADEDVDLGHRLQGLKQLPLEQAQAAAEQLLLRFVGNRQLFLIAENLGEIFDDIKGMGREGQQKFRDLVQQHPFWTVIASSQALFEDIQVREAPFYGFFKVHHLGMFDLDEAVTLLKKLAIHEGRIELRNFFNTELGKGRIRAIHQLTGGNPRLLVIFYQFIDRESIADLASPFLEMVDSLTSYYQEQMQPLPALQQKIVEFLCERRTTATVKEISQSCFITHQTASKQLSRLAERRYVISTTVGRESYFELREPLFRICFEVKENLGYPIRLFVDFLGTFYSVEELKRKYRSTRLLRLIYQRGGVAPQTKKVDIELGYIERETLPFTIPERETIGKVVEELFSERDYGEAFKLAEAAYDLKLGGSEFLLKSAKGRRKMGDLPGARERADRLVHSDPENSEAWIEKAAVEEAAGDLNTAEASYRRALELDGRNEDALVGFLWPQGDHARALECFERVTELHSDYGEGWRLLGLAQEITGETAAARHSYEKATELAPESAAAWESRGLFLWDQADHARALECFERVTELRSDYGEGWRLLGIAQEKAGALDAAETSLKTSTDLEPVSLSAWTSRAEVAFKREKAGVGKKCLQKAEALGADSAYEFIHLGEVYRNLGIYDKAIAQHRRALELEPGNCFAYFNVALALFESADLDAGLKQMEMAAGAGVDQDWASSMPLCITEINDHLLQKVELDRLPELLTRQRAIFEKMPLRDFFIQGLTGALMDLLRKHDDIAAERLLAIRDRILPKLSSTEELSVACRLFTAGVSYLETRDPRVLLKLPREERQSLEELLKPVRDRQGPGRDVAADVGVSA